jgi:hypothetical protein
MDDPRGFQYTARQKHNNSTQTKTMVQLAANTFQQLLSAKYSHFQIGTQRSTIDYIFAPRTVASDITNAQQHFFAN